MRTGWTARFGLALGASLGVAISSAVLVWQLTSPVPLRPLAVGEVVELPHWRLRTSGLTVAEELPVVAGAEPVVARPGARIVVLAIEVTYTDPVTLHDSGCEVLFRTRDGAHEWRSDNDAVYRAAGSEGQHSCLVQRAYEDVPAEAELGGTVPITFSVEVPDELADQVVAEVRMQDFTEGGSGLRWHQGQVAGFRVG